MLASFRTACNKLNKPYNDLIFLKAKLAALVNHDEKNFNIDFGRTGVSM